MQASMSQRSLYNIYCLGKGLPLFRLTHNIYDSLKNTTMSREQLLHIYNACIQEPYGFLIIDNRDTATFKFRDKLLNIEQNASPKEERR